MSDIIFSPSDFVAALNQTMEYAYPVVVLEGELANIRISRGKWVYFDIKDEQASIKCFGTVYMLPGPIEEGMMARITASPRLHPLYNFSLNLHSMTPVGEGSLKRAADLLLEKLTKEGLFDESRKRAVPYAPQSIGLITSKESAAYADFIKILNERWVGVRVVHQDVQVQGDAAVGDIVQAITAMNQLPDPPEVLVITRGGGSADDLAAFSSEQVVRAIAGSRIPTLVAIGHEVDLSLGELAADMRASTPSNAAQLLVPERAQIQASLKEQRTTLGEILRGHVRDAERQLVHDEQLIRRSLEHVFTNAWQLLDRQRDLLEALNPQMALKRGYAVIRSGNVVIKSVKSLTVGEDITLNLRDGMASAVVNRVQPRSELS